MGGAAFDDCPFGCAVLSHPLSQQKVGKREGFKG
jgi:hypothetical protein